MLLVLWFTQVIPVQVPKSSLFFRILVGGSPTSREAASGLVLLLVSASLWDDPYHPPHPGNHRCRIPPCSVAGGVVTFSGSGTYKKPYNLSSFSSSGFFSVQNNYAYTCTCIIMYNHITLFMMLTINQTDFLVSINGQNHNTCKRFIYYMKYFFQISCFPLSIQLTDLVQLALLFNMVVCQLSQNLQLIKLQLRLQSGLNRLQYTIFKFTSVRIVKNHV